MNIMHKVTWACMRKNKRRTTVTIMGVTICVAMLCATCILVTSFQDALLRGVYEERGSYQAFYNMENVADVNALAQEKEIAQSLRMSSLGSASLKDDEVKIENSYRTSISLIGMDVKQAELNGVVLKKGRMPKNENEIVCSEELLEEKGFSYNLKDKITLHVKTEDVYDADGNLSHASTLQIKTYTITGFVQCNSEQKQSYSYYAFTSFQEATQGSTYQLYVTFKDTSNINSTMKSLGDKYHIPSENFAPNTALAMLQGTSNDNMLTTVVIATMILFLIIVIGGVSLIYNAFSISLSERSRYLGMLSSIGATRKQKRNSVFFEAMMIGIVSIPLGIFASIAGLTITFAILNPSIHEIFGFTSLGLKVIVNGWSILITILMTVFILLLSAWLPAHKAAKISAIEAIRENKTIKIKKRRVSYRITRKLFGIEGELGLKNMKRNRSRYVATLSSLIVCVVLFMCANYFSAQLKKSLFYVNTSEVSGDVIVFLTPYTDGSGDSNNLLPNKQLIKELQQVPHATKSNYDISLDYYLSEDTVLSDDAQAFLKSSYGIEGAIAYASSEYPQVSLQILDDESFQTYLKEVGGEKADFQTREPSIVLVNKDTVQYANQRKYQDVTWLETKEKESLQLLTYDSLYGENSESVGTPQQLQIACITDKKPAIKSDENLHYSPRILAVSDVHNLTLLNDAIVKEKLSPLAPIFRLHFYTEDDMALEQELNAVLDKYDIRFSGSIQNFSQETRIAEQQMLLGNTFLYGFSILIAIICIANIMNTISTGILLRKREFAMLRSIGITKKKFRVLMAFEILVYGVKACLYGGIIGTLLMVGLHKVLNRSFIRMFEFPYMETLMMILVVFLVLILVTQYAMRKIRKDNIVETIRQESI